MKHLRKIVAAVLCVTMLSTLFTSISFAEDVKAGDELVILKAEKKADVTKAIAKASPEAKIVKESKYSAKWDMGAADGITVSGVPKDVTAYTELKMNVYATHEVTMYTFFSTNNENTDGADYYGKMVNLTEGWQEISLPFAELSKSREPSFGNVANLEFNCSGWGQTKNDKASVYFDKIVLVNNPQFAGVVATTPAPTPEPLPDGKAGTTRYVEEDFEKTDKIGGAAKDNKITIEEKDGNHYLQILKTGETDGHYDLSIKNTTRYVVVSVDAASTKFPQSDAQLITCKYNGGQHTFVYLNSKGEITANGKVAGTMKDNGKFVNVAIAGDFINGKYDVYIDGKKKLENLTFGSGSGTVTPPTLYRAFMGAGSDDGANIMIDNLKIFDGLTPDDYKNTISAEESEAKNLAEAIGKPSPIIDLGTTAIAYLDMLNGVAINIHSGYIYANKQKTLPDVRAYVKNDRTLLPVRAISEALGCDVSWDGAANTATIDGKAKIVIGSNQMTLADGSTYELDVPAEVTDNRTFIPLRALCEKVLGKEVTWNDRGLIILTDSPINMTDANIAAINNFMLYDRPQAAQLKQMFNEINKNTHPRIVFDKAEFDTMYQQYQTNDVMHEIGGNIISAADKKLNLAHEQYIIPDGLRLLSTCRAVLDKVLNLSMAYKLTKDEKYKTYLWEEIENAGNFVDWNHKLHYLDVGEMSMAFAIAYDWLYDDWTDEQRKFMEEAIYKHSLTWTQRALYGFCDYPNFFVTANTNWNAVCNGGTGCAAIAVFDKYPDLCADILEKNYASLEKMMTEFYPDGAWYEGPGYWEYLMQFLAFFMTSSEAAFKTDFNICKAPGFSKTGEFYLSSDGMTGSNNYHDASSAHLMSDYLYWLADEFDESGLTKINFSKKEKYSSSIGGVYSFIYLNPNHLTAEAATLPLDTYFANTEIVNMRSSWTDDGGIYASMHNGKNNVNHMHLDAGTFVCDIGGQRFAGDIGAEDYNIDGYWGDKRCKYYRARPEGHNVVVINPDESYGQNLNGADVISKFETKSKGSFAIAPLSHSYNTYATSVDRGLMLADNRRSVLIRDEIRGMKKDVNTVYWFMQMENVKTEIVDKTTAILTKNNVRVKLRVLSDADDCEITVTEPKVLETSPNLPNQNPNSGWKRLAIKFTSGKDLNINVKMALEGDPLGDSEIKDVSLKDWSIEDGAIPEFPKLNSISVAGEEIKNFEKESTYYVKVLPYGTTEIPSVTAQCSETADTQITLPTELPGTAQIKVFDKSDNRLQTVYMVFLRAASNIEIETSGAQEGNPGENCLDDDLFTRWAVEGESWGIFRFAQLQKISSVWLATWKAAERKLKFSIEVSEDGENFKQVFDGMTTAEEDVLEEIKIPEGTYKAVKLVLHGTTTGTWNSILEVKFK